MVTPKKKIINKYSELDCLVWTNTNKQFQYVHVCVNLRRVNFNHEHVPVATNLSVKFQHPNPKVATTEMLHFYYKNKNKKQHCTKVHF